MILHFAIQDGSEDFADSQPRECEERLLVLFAGRPVKWHGIGHERHKGGCIGGRGAGIPDEQRDTLEHPLGLQQCPGLLDITAEGPIFLFLFVGLFDGFSCLVEGLR